MGCTGRNILRDRDSNTGSFICHLDWINQNLMGCSRRWLEDKLEPNGVGSKAS